MTQAEAWGAFALLCCVGAIVFGAVRFHRARASLRDASQARMNQWVAEMAAHAAAATQSGDGDSTHAGAVNEVAAEPTVHPVPAEHVMDEPAVESADVPADESGEPPVAEPVVAPKPVDVRSEMDAFFGNGLPPTGR